jgi:hypothetical protein
MKRLLWLDDYRDPITDSEWLMFSPIFKPYMVFWVKSYNEFVEWIEKNGLPDGICFDHDLADEHYRPSMYNPDGHYSNYYTDGTFKEKTGYDAAKWLVEYCLDNNLDLPKFNVQSANPIGKKNIISILTNFNKIKSKL